MTLDQLPPGQRGRIAALAGDPDAVDQLEALDEAITVLRNDQ